MRIISAFTRAASLAAVALSFSSLVACADDFTAPALRPGALRGLLADSAAPHVDRMTIAPDTARVVIGRITRLAVVVRDTAGAVVDRTVAWTSSDTTVARVDSAGVVTGVAVGAATVTATSDSLAAHAVVTVHDGSVYRVAVAPNALTVVAGDTLTLGASPLDAQDASVDGAAVRWTSAADSVVAVDARTGAIHALTAGATWIRATSGSHVDSARVTVAPGIAAVRIVGALDTLEAYDTRALHAVYVDSAGRTITHGLAVSRRTLRWSSSDTTLARIDSITGVLTGVDRGTVTITATSDSLHDSVRRVVIIRYRSITSGTEHACDIASGGIAWCWGLNAKEGRLGQPDLSDTAKSTVPVRVPGDHPFTQLATYGRTTCGLTTDGRAYCWGFNGWGMLGIPTATGSTPTPTLVSSTLRFRLLTTGDDFVCGLAVDDRAYCWGYNAWGQFGTGKTGSSTTPMLAAGGMTFTTLSAGSSFTCGITAKGEAYCFGASGWGQIGDGTKISFGNTYVTTPQRVVGEHVFRAIHASNQYVCALRLAGDSWCWGNNSGGAFGIDKPSQSSTPVATSGGLTFRSLTAGYSNVCGVATDDALYCWGSNKDGQLGNAAAGNGSPKPIRAAGTLTFAEASAANVTTGGGSYTCGIAADRLTTHCWGRNDKGQLGTGTVTPLGAPNPTPSVVAGQKPLPAEK